MESLILSNHSLQNLDLVDVEIKQSSKTAVYLDLSNNFLKYKSLKITITSFNK